MVKWKNVLGTIIVIVIIIAGVLLVKSKLKKNTLTVPAASPTTVQKLQNKFNGLVIPPGEPSIDLKDVSGGSGMGIATRSEIVADLPDLSAGQVYRAYLENSSGDTVFLGGLKSEKGGWILNFDSSKYPDYNNIVVAIGSKHILEGSF